MASPWNRVVLLCLLITVLSLHHIGPGRGTLVAAQKLSFFKQKQHSASDPQAARREQQAVEALHALSSSSSPPTSDQQATLDLEKKKRLSKGKGIQDLLAAVEASHASSATSGDPKEQDSGKTPDTKSPKATKKLKKTSAHAGDIIHEQDHADNDAYDDIVWYDGPHRDDEDEHEEDDHDDDHDDDHHHDHDDEEDEEEEVKERQKTKMTPEVLANLQKLSGTPVSGLENQGQGQQVFQNDHDHDHLTTDASHEDAKVFQHSGADVIVTGISPKEFCLRLKHECESTCREFTAEVEHLPTSCDAGSVAELLFWGRCCQIGQEHRRTTEGGAKKTMKKKTTIHLNKSRNLEYTGREESAEGRQEQLIEEHVRSQLKRHQAQQEMHHQKPR